MKFLQLLVSFFLYISFSSAWPYPSEQDAALMPRQQNIPITQPASTNSGSSQPSGAATTGVKTASGTNTGSGSGTRSAAASTNSGSGTSTLRASGSSNSTRKATPTSIDNRLPPGGISMITPAPLSTTYYKIGDPVTFVWNYTSLLAPPPAIDVIVSCSTATYTLSANMSVQETGSIVWDTSEPSGAIKLGLGHYTLAVYDASQPTTAIPGAGHLGAYNPFQFAMYTPGVYQNLSEYFCATCNSGSNLERQTLSVMIGVAAVTVLSFTWFANGFMGGF